MSVSFSSCAKPEFKINRTESESIREILVPCYCINPPVEKMRKAINIVMLTEDLKNKKSEYFVSLQFN